MSMPTDQLHGYETTSQRKTDAQWIEIFAHYFVAQQHIAVKTRGVTIREGTITQIDSGSVHVVGIHGTDHQIPFSGIEEVTQVGDAAMPLGPRETQHIYEFAGFMARREHLRLETADDCIEQAEVRHITRSGITIVDTVDSVEISLPFKDLTHTQSAGME